MRIRISNGHVIDPANNIDQTGDICIASGKVVSVLDKNRDFREDKTVDAGNKIVIPGIIDLCARFREPGLEYKATITSESKAAASGGVTGICCPPDTHPVLDSPSVIELIHQRKKMCNTRIFPLGALTLGLQGERLAEMYTLMKAGCIGVSNGNRPVQNTEVLRRAMEYAASFNIQVFFFPEDYYLRNSGVVHEGATSTRLGLPPYPATAETIAVSQAILLMEQTGVRLHLCRISAAKSVELIADAKKNGLPVTADTGICHLHLSDADIGYYDTNRHLIPPLRSEQDRKALIKALSKGIVDVVCSDHQPHNEDAKAAPFSESEPGASTIEMLFALVFRLVKDRAISLNDAVAALTARPAGILGIDHGTLSVGSEADLAIIDIDREFTVSRNLMISSGKNTPFEGWKLMGNVSSTMLKGKVIYQNNN